MDKVRLNDVSRVYGRTFALHRLTVDFPAGQITAVLGRNGAGKSTLVNLLATLDAPTSGSIHFGDVDFRAFARRFRHRIGWVGHEPMLYDELNAIENLEFFAQMYGLVDFDAASWTEAVGLKATDTSRPVAEYSRGMKQRLSIARAALHKPPLMLMDEPFTGLDSRGRATIVEMMKRWASAGRVVIVVTHDLQTAEHVADLALVLESGADVYRGADLTEARRVLEGA